MKHIRHRRDAASPPGVIHHVELTDEEVVLYERFHALLDEGYGIPQAAAKVFLDYLDGRPYYRKRGPVNVLFVFWLSERCLRWAPISQQLMWTIKGAEIVGTVPSAPVDPASLR